MQKERLEAGSERGLAGTFLTEEIENREMPCLTVDNVSKKSGEKVAYRNPCLFAIHLYEHCCEIIQFDTIAVLMYHQSLKLVYLVIISVHLRCRRYIVCLAVGAPDNAEIIHSTEYSTVIQSVAKSEELPLAIPSKFPYPLCRIGLLIYVFFSTLIYNLSFTQKLGEAFSLKNIHKPRYQLNRYYVTIIISNGTHGTNY